MYLPTIMKNLSLLILILITIILVPNFCLATDIIRFPWTGHPEAIKKDYYLALLKLALEKSEKKFGAYELVKFDIPINQFRAIHFLESKNNVDLLWTMTSIDREERLLAIRIPLVKGVMGCRIFLIRKGEQYRFDLIKDVAGLKTLYAGQGRNWPDSSILKYNGFNVIDGSEYSGLFSMLKLHRFDYFPRGVHEPWQEQIMFNDLIVEKKLLLQYPSPFFFFVNKSNERLAKRIEFGLEQAIEDGSFEHLFNQHRDTKDVFRKANLSNRIVFKLDNPLLSKETRELFAKGSPYELDCTSFD